ncbi:RrF2 family transcriptional regulator [Catenuloplanes japonicus]|uniref:RrF2 family transcriptional regulator n=1 Tax=Catenuloplanes japonicus TaxID=33876 RepID=UPI0005267A7F|nr:Rrf2 family transcriptional regulator [Catenuloplanes japonicus]
MRLNRSTDIGLRILMLTAARGGQQTIEEAAAALDVPRHHLAKVVQRLQHLGLLETVRGRGGGVRLTAEAEETTIGGIVRSLEDEAEVVVCDGATPCPLRGGCRLRGALARAQEAFYASLDEVTLGSLTGTPTGPILLSLGR